MMPGHGKSAATPEPVYVVAHQAHALSNVLMLTLKARYGWLVRCTSLKYSLLM